MEQGLGIVGAVIMPHNLYLHSGLVLVSSVEDSHSDVIPLTGSAIKSMFSKLECGLFTTFGYAVYYAALSIHILYHGFPLYLLYHSRSSVYVYFTVTLCVYFLLP